MKRLISVCLCFAIIIGIFGGAADTVHASCLTEQESDHPLLVVSETIAQISDDLYIIEIIYEKPTLTRANRYTKTAQKTRSIVNNSGELLCSFTIVADYIITSGISSTCTSVSHSYQIYNSNWNYVSGSSYKSGNCAYGSAEFNHKLLGIVIETRNCNISLACDVNGNLS